MYTLNQKYLDSREVAEMVGKEHHKLMRDIRTYMSQLGESKIGCTEFFSESTYKTAQNKKMPCFLVTKKGCEFIAHKLTGIKGTEFTAKYINRFHEMEGAIKDSMPHGDKLIALAVIEAHKMLEAKDEEIKQLETTVVAKDQMIGELKPKADYTDMILQNKGLVTMTQIAKDYGMSAREMNQTLHAMGIQYKQSGQWLLYSQYHGLGYTHSETVNIVRNYGSPDVKMITKWTQKGRLFIYDSLKKSGIFPVIEQL